METTLQKNSIKGKIKKDILFLSTVLISAGIVITGFHTGLVSEHFYSILISWPSALIIAGIWSLLHSHYNSGMFVIAIGSFLIIPIINGDSALWFQTYWPWLLIMLGVYILLHLFLPKKKYYNHYEIDENYTVENGYITSANEFNKLRKIVPDYVFKGAKIKNNFGGTVLDLRNTSLQTGDTYIDIDSSFGGIELFIPDNWFVDLKINATFSAVDDKRYKITGGMDSDKRLIIRGKINFSGVEIKG